VNGTAPTNRRRAPEDVETKAMIVLVEDNDMYESARPLTAHSTGI
jgi:hypothetical protein